MKTGYLKEMWWAKQDQDMSGWCVMPLDEDPMYGVEPVASFLTKELAYHIAALHNAWLQDGINGIY